MLYSTLNLFALTFGQQATGLLVAVFRFYLRVGHVAALLRQRCDTVAHAFLFPFCNVVIGSP